MWHDSGDLSLAMFSPTTPADVAESYRRYRYAVGGGIRINTPVGPFRLDWGYKVNPPLVPADQKNKPPRHAFHLSLGQAF